MYWVYLTWCYQPGALYRYWACRISDRVKCSQNVHSVGESYSTIVLIVRQVFFASCKMFARSTLCWWVIVFDYYGTGKHVSHVQKCSQDIRCVDESSHTSSLRSYSKISKLEKSHDFFGTFFLVGSFYFADGVLSNDHWVRCVLLAYTCQYSIKR